MKHTMNTARDPLRPDDEANNNSDDDARLLRRFTAAGDRSAFDRLVHRHAGMARAVALRCCGDASAPADRAVQNVITRLAGEAASLPAEHIAAWVHRATFLAARRALSETRGAPRAAAEPAARASESPSATLPQTPRWEAVRPHLDAAVACLTIRSRHLLILRCFERRSLPEIIARTGKSETAITRGLHLSLQNLSGLLRPRGVHINAAALGAMLSAQNLLAPPAATALLAANALSCG